MTKRGVFTVSNEAKDLIRNLLNAKPDERYSAKDALNSSWFEESDKDETEDSDISDISEKVNNDNAILQKSANDVFGTKKIADSVNAASVTTQGDKPSAAAA